MTIDQGRHWRQDLLLLSLLFSVVFGLFLGSRPLSTPDEARYAEIPREMVVQQDYLIPHLNGLVYFEKPPLFYWLQASSIRLLGVNEWAVRLPNALLALLSCLIVYSAGRILFNRRSGVLASIILASNLLYCFMARLFTTDMSVSAFLTGSLLAFLLAVYYPLGRRRRALLYSSYVCAAMAVLAKGLIGLLFPVLIIGLWTLLWQEWHFLKTLYLPSGALLFLAVVLPWHLLAQYRYPQFLYFYFIEQHLLRYTTLIANRYQPIWFFGLVVLLGFLPWIVFLPQAIRFHWPQSGQTPKEKQNSAFLLLWVGIIFIFFSLSHSKLIPYILPTFPALALLVGNYLAYYWDTASSVLAIKLGYLILPLLWMGLIASAIGVVHYKAIAVSASAMPYLLAGAGIFLVNTLVAFGFFNYGVSRLAFISLVTAGLSTVLMISTHLPHIDQRSIKPLAATLGPLLRTGDRIVMYNHYYHDLPFYLQQLVTTVNIRGELAFGLLYQDNHPNVLHDAQFWPIWHSAQRVFMFTSWQTYRELSKIPRHFYQITASAKDVLVSNQPL